MINIKFDRVWYEKYQWADFGSYTPPSFVRDKYTLPLDSLDLAATYDTIATTYTTIDKYDLALGYFNKALEIREARLPFDHRQIGAIYNNIGWLYECKNSYKKALDYYQKALEISRKTLPPTHQRFTQTEKSIRQVKDKIKH